MVAMLFSFLLVWDMPAVARGVAGLGRSPTVGFAYREIAPRVATFSEIVGKAFEVQILLAVINTVLTGAGMVKLGIPGSAFLSLIVFICSFIPVAGDTAHGDPAAHSALQDFCQRFFFPFLEYNRGLCSSFQPPVSRRAGIAMSTIPMLLVGVGEHGIGKAAECLAMVAGVHALEAYLVYPQLYAHKLKLPPLLVLAALYVTEHLVGMQGLFLALPVAVYAQRLISGSEADAPDPTSAAGG